MTRTMTIEGMMCTHCSGRVEKALNAIEGVRATVDLDSKTATVTGEVEESVLRRAVEAAGYTVTAVQ